MVKKSILRPWSHFYIILYIEMVGKDARLSKTHLRNFQSTMLYSFLNNFSCFLGLHLDMDVFLIFYIFTVYFAIGELNHYDSNYSYGSKHISKPELIYFIYHSKYCKNYEFRSEEIDTVSK
jgi:hypothetical protein